MSVNGEDTTAATDPDWEFDAECPECGHSVYLAAIVTERDDDGTPIKADLMCGERYYRQHMTGGIGTAGDDVGCWHTWEYDATETEGTA